MSVSGLITIINTATEGLFGIILLVIIWLVVYTRRRHITPGREAIVGASFASLIISFPMRYLQLLNDWTWGIVIVITLGSIIMLINRQY